MNFKSVNPYTEQVEAIFPETTSEEIERTLSRAQKTFNTWKNYSFKERASVMKKVAARLRREKKSLSEMMTREMGKPIMQSLAEVEKCAWACEYFAANGEKFLETKSIRTEAKESFVTHEPMGVILGIMPWNFPLWQVFRFAAPTLIAGNVIVLKHASNVPTCAQAIERIFSDAGAPAGLFSTLLIDSKKALALVGDSRIAGVSLTGSTSAGLSVAKRAAEVLKKSVLELGGSDPLIVLDDRGDLKSTVTSAMNGRIINNGQSCIAAKRFFVQQKISSDFEKELAKQFDALQLDDPMDADTDVGPLARKDLVENLRGQVSRSIKMGGKLLTKRPGVPRKGFFFPPTVVGKVRMEMPLFSEETFGPAIGVIPFASWKEAVSLANNSPYGLGASIWTKNVAKAHEMIPHIQSGNVFVNRNVASDPRLPFGGVKQSGWGKELGKMGIREFVHAKTVWINK